MRTTSQKFLTLVSHSFPVILAILIYEVVTIILFNYSPLGTNKALLYTWWIFQNIAGFTFGIASDKHYRKKILILSQGLGVISGIILFFFHAEFWALLLIAISFNPLPVTRAALIDNFPQYPKVRIIGVTYFAQYLPWLFYPAISKIDYHVMIWWILFSLAVNIVLTQIFFKDNYDRRKLEKKPPIPTRKKPFLKILLIAYILVEISSFFFWDELSYIPKIQYAIPTATIAPLLGFVIAMMYSRLPHISTITLSYLIGAALFIILLVQYHLDPSFTTDTMINGITHYSIVGGIYYVFVADLVIDTVGSQRKGFGSALIELSDTISAIIATLFGYLFLDNIRLTLIFFISLYLIAAGLQKYGEKWKEIPGKATHS